MNPITTVNLSRAIMTHNGEVSEIILREPTAGDFVRFGKPFKFRPDVDDSEIDYDDKAMMAFLVACSGYDETALGGLSASDHAKCLTYIKDIIRGIAGDEPYSIISRMIAILTLDYHMDPDTVEGMTLSRLEFYVRQAVDLSKERAIQFAAEKEKIVARACQQMGVDINSFAN